MTLTEHRTKCIEAIARTLCLIHSGETDHWQEFIEDAVIILDSLRDIARVLPIEATEEMIRAGIGKTETDAWRAMSAAGDLTNPPEQKP